MKLSWQAAGHSGTVIFLSLFPPEQDRGCTRASMCIRCSGQHENQAQVLRLAGHVFSFPEPSSQCVPLTSLLLLFHRFQRIKPKPFFATQIEKKGTKYAIGFRLKCCARRLDK